MFDPHLITFWLSLSRTELDRSRPLWSGSVFMCSILEGLESNWVLVSSDPLEKSIGDFLSSSNIPNDTKTEQMWLSVAYIILTFIQKCCQCLFWFQITPINNLAKCGNFTKFLPSTGRCCHLECQNTTDDDVPGGVKLPSGRTGWAARGCRDHEPASVHWADSHLTGQAAFRSPASVTGSRTGIICTVKTPGDARGLRLCYANETWLVTLIPMLLPLPVTELGIQPRCYCRVLAERQTLHQGPGFDPSCCSITCGCHKIIGREKYYERLSFIDAIWKVGHVIIYFPKLKGGHKTKINLPFKYDWTIWT